MYIFVSLQYSTSFLTYTLLNFKNASDHAYGSNLFTFGGKIEGRKILGQYPDDLTYETGPLIINQRGIGKQLCSQICMSFLKRLPCTHALYE